MIRDVCEALDRISRVIKAEPYVSKLKDPFKILISTVISSRTKDEVTEEVSKRLFKKIKSPKDLLEIDDEELERMIYPAGFYRNKAKILKKLADFLIRNYKGKVPDNLEDLLKLPGVGRKTANLVLVLGFGKDGIAVDTHVHRIFNRWGVVKTKNPIETEMELRKIVPKRCWSKINKILVQFGKEICRPIKPKCELCPLKAVCPSAKI